MAAKLIRDSGADTIDYTAVTAISAEDVVVAGDMIGVARRAIAVGGLGALHLSGTYDFSIATAGTVSTGADVYWDDTNDLVVTTASGNKYLGKTVAAKASGDILIRTRLTQSEDPNDA